MTLERRETQMKKVFAAAIVLAAVSGLAALAGCCGGTSANGKTYTISSKSINASAGDEFIVELESNQTTGFQWGIAGSLDPSVLKKVSSKYVPSANPSGQMGAGGKELWAFKAVRAGTTTIAMTYTQPFDKAASPAETATFTVTVK